MGIVSVLLESGAELTQSNTKNLNVLGSAAMHGHCELVKEIYDKLVSTKSAQEVADFVNAADTVNGWTPLHLAFMQGHEDVAKFLLNTANADALKQGFEGKTALYHASEKGELERKRRNLKLGDTVILSGHRKGHVKY